MARLEALGREIRAEAAARDIPLTALCDRAGVTRSALYRYLSAERDMPVSVLMDIADELHIQASALLARAEQRARRYN